MQLKPEVLVMENKYLTDHLVHHFIQAVGFNHITNINKHKGSHQEYYAIYYTSHLHLENNNIAIWTVLFYVLDLLFTNYIIIS